MLIKFKKAHLRHKAGEVAHIVEGVAKYCIKMGIATEVIKPIEQSKEVEKPTVTKAKRAKKK